MLAGFNEFGFNESSRFNELIFAFKYFLLHKNFGFNEYPGLTNNWLGPERFVKSGDHCSNSIYVTGFCTLTRDFMLNWDSLKWDFTVVGFVF